MKIALCFSGQPRFISRCYQNIRDNILEPNGFPDVYVHTWFPEPHPEGHRIANNHIGDEDGIEQIIKLYQPVGITIEKPKKFPTIITDANNPFAPYQYITQSMFYSIEKSMDLVGQQYKFANYNVICRIRFDDIFHHPIIFKNYNLLKLNIPNESSGRMNDHFGFGHCHTLDGYRNAYKYIESFYQTTGKIVPEEVLEFSCRYHQTLVEKHNWKMETVR
jgi:hypothetical protein